jgi:hypothetical protein
MEQNILPNTIQIQDLPTEIRVTYPQQQQEQSSSNKLPTSSTICQPPPEKKKKRIDVDAINILAKDSLKTFFEERNYKYIHEDFVQALYQFSIKQREQTSAGSEQRNNE